MVCLARGFGVGVALVIISKSGFRINQGVTPGVNIEFG